MGRRVAVEDSRSELGRTAHLRAERSSCARRGLNERSRTCLGRMGRVCRDHTPKTFGLTAAADRAGGHQYAAAEKAEGPGCCGPRGLCLSIYLGAELVTWRIRSIGDARPSLHESCMSYSHYHIFPANRCGGRYSGRLQLAFLRRSAYGWMA